jgi:hypothetical protein
LLTITRPAKYKRFPSESWLNISPKDSSEVYNEFSKRIVLECLYSISLAKESGIYLKQYAVDCNDLELLEKRLFDTMMCKWKLVHIINIKILTSEHIRRIRYRCNVESVISVVNLSEYSFKLFKFYVIFSDADKIVFP